MQTAHRSPQPEVEHYIDSKAQQVDRERDEPTFQHVPLPVRVGFAKQRNHPRIGSQQQSLMLSC